MNHAEGTVPIKQKNRPNLSLEILLHWMSGLPLTLIGLVSLGIGIIVSLDHQMTPTVLLAPGYAILFINLLAALFLRPKIRRSLPLLLFHIGLLFIMLTVAHSRLVYFKGWVILGNDDFFTQTTGVVSQGPLHNNNYAKLNFQQHDFNAYFGDNNRRLKTESYVSFDKGETFLQISDKESLTVDGYNFNISSQLGFTAHLTWLDNSGEINMGKVYFPSQIGFEDTQWMQFYVGAQQLQVSSKLVILEDRQSYFTPKFHAPTDYHLQLKTNGVEKNLREGDFLPLATGTLRLEGLEPWIGYDVYYDPNILLILNASIFTVMCLLWFFAQKISVDSWKLEDHQQI